MFAVVILQFVTLQFCFSNTGEKKPQKGKRRNDFPAGGAETPVGPSTRVSPVMCYKKLI
jgi:hypothetical protein